MHIIGTIIIGFLAGVVAKLLMPGRDPGGFIVTTLLGIIGAFVATYLGQAIGWYQADEGAGFVGAVVGAVILLAIYHFVKRRSAGSPRSLQSNPFPKPPVSKIFSSCSNVAVCANRAVVNVPAEENEPVAGSYSSAETMPPRHSLSSPLFAPPATSTFPFASSVAV